MSAFNLFKKSEGKKEQPKKKVAAAAPVTVESRPAAITAGAPGNGRVLRHIHVSEKAARLTGFRQYVFEVEPAANKQEIKKQVEKMFNVKVTGVNVVNVPSKKRIIGRYMGTKSGYRKAIVTLAEGYAIEEAKA
ncbi:MAG TPA: 50S ribosomal protein L23 [Candidatus Paceibacterota bacterium]|nr:50S ribosomal protein L23 [Candidatus Paceibacterota bacterium]